MRDVIGTPVLVRGNIQSTMGKTVCDMDGGLFLVLAGYDDKGIIFPDHCR
jgi:hypothetical protein